MSKFCGLTSRWRILRRWQYERPRNSWNKNNFTFFGWRPPAFFSRYCDKSVFWKIKKDFQRWKTILIKFELIIETSLLSWILKLNLDTWWGYYCGLEWHTRGEIKRKKGEVKLRLYSSMMRIASGRPLEVHTQLLWLLVKALPAMSAKVRLWSTKCGSWLSLAVLTCAM